MTSIVVIGSQWGDEGKGKIVDWLAERAELVVRFNGGHNAGHTLVIDGKTYKLALLPSGLVRGLTSVIGNGVVVDPHHFLEEVARLRGQGVRVDPDLLVLSEAATLILPLHRELDSRREGRGAGLKIGTTQRGIGPAYEDKVGRRAIRVADLAEPDTLAPKIERLLDHHNPLRAGLGLPPLDPEAMRADLIDVAAGILPFMGRPGPMIDAACRRGAHVLFEGAQGALLDIDHGTYPFVTSSSTVSGGAAAGSGIGPSSLGYVLGLTKAYSTRVGGGPMPTEQVDAIGDMLGERGREFGVNTGRKRRCGWFDAVVVRQSVRTCGIHGIALTKIDVLDAFDEIRVCVGYELDGARIDYLPTTADAQERLRPIYETMPGWAENTAGIRDFARLPARAQAYVRFVEDAVAAPVALVSTSPERADTIVLRDPFGVP